MAEKEVKTNKEEIKAKTEEGLKKGIDEEKAKQELLKISEISLWLDTYDDIFSDFDPRPFAQRALSIDFLDEAKRASRDKVSGQTEIKFLIPKDLRNSDKESQIKKRLREHFKRHHDIIKKEKKKTLAKAVLFVVLGFAMLAFAAFIDYLGKEEFVHSLIIIFLEPAGWFTFWFSLEQLFKHFEEKLPELQFYEKMIKSEISFVDY